MEINGIAHIVLTVRDLARSKAFYVPLLEAMGLAKVIDNRGMLYFVGGKTAVGLRPASPEFAAEAFVQARAGLHHVCFRARARADVDALHALVLAAGARVVHPPQEDGWLPGYYSVLFEDPDGIRLEVNHVPGRGIEDVGADAVKSG